MERGRKERYKKLAFIAHTKEFGKVGKKLKGEEGRTKKHYDAEPPIGTSGGLR